MNKYLVLNYPGSGNQSDHDWAKFFDRIGTSGKFNGGSALGSRWGLTQSGITMATAQSLAGYFIFSAENEKEVAELLKHCPIITSGGSVDIIALQVDE